jgi:S-adenosyl-L-methionine hydrolase (adenosine-forming)
MVKMVMMKNNSFKSIVFLLVMLLSLSAGSGCNSQKAVNMPIVLLTDYGVEDYRISQLKGIIYSNFPEASVIDASHSVPAFDIYTGAFMLDIAAKEFPENVVFIAIVAPYTPPVTEYIVLTNNKNQIFVVPDNTLIGPVIKRTGIKTLYRVTNEGLFDKPIKELVAERIEGKVGALIASGSRMNDIGTATKDYKASDIQEPAIVGNKLVGTVIYIDHYGNAVTNIPQKIAAEFGLKPGDIVRVKVLQDEIYAKFGIIYSDVPRGDVIAFVCNNLDMVQLSINLGNFAEVYGVKAGIKVEIDK